MTGPRQAYPLTWPQGVPRSPDPKRAKFGTVGTTATSWGSHRSRKPLTIARGYADLAMELDRLGARDVIVSTNLRLRLDGAPRSGQREPEDSGVAVYFDLDGRDTCLPCDRWDRVADNLRAVAKFVEAMRGMERWVGHDMIESAFMGFQALPAPGDTAGIDPWQYLGLDRSHTVETTLARIRAQLRDAHPDKGGTQERFDLVNRAAHLVRQEIARG